MRVRLIPESTGFGYSGKIVDWITEAEDHVQLLEKLQSGLTVEFPARIARSIFNLVDVETGEVVSTRTTLMISKEEIKKKYTDYKRTEQAQFKATVKNILTPEVTKKINQHIIKSSEEEIE